MAFPCRSPGRGRRLPPRSGRNRRTHARPGLAGTWVRGPARTARPVRSISTTSWTTTGAWPSTARRRWSGRPAMDPVLALELMPQGVGRRRRPRARGEPPVPFLVSSAPAARHGRCRSARRPRARRVSVGGAGRRHSAGAPALAPALRPRYVSRTWARLAWISRCVRRSVVSSRPKPAFTLLKSGFQSSSRSSRAVA